MAPHLCGGTRTSEKNGAPNLIKHKPKRIAASSNRLPEKSIYIRSGAQRILRRDMWKKVEKQLLVEW
ncbi:hypothetical protein NDU88_002567 [Pleurodeles waltl]|uniref:Uncharacterized protein n=1 Tax=Pleurodeles waltl TaxID=8319 RepID=A0AAV7PAD6_PLEWA|nr:hypothetical protein NDU88_002567 [Pleurodeles waltl]